MIVQRNSTVVGTILPEIVETLSADFRAPLFHRDLKLRQPIGIYFVSLGAVLSGFETVLDELEIFLRNKPFANYEDIPEGWRIGPSDPKLLKAQRQLLYALMEHMEDCFNILKCFVPLPSLDPRKRKKAAYCKDPTVNTCVTSVATYWDHISGIVNHSKHNQGRLRGLVISTEKYLMPGYFVESCEEIVAPTDGQITWEVLGPSSVIHGKNRDTAYSFARDIRYHFVQVYIVAKHLSDSVKTLVAGQSTPRPIDQSSSAQILQIAKRIEKLPMYFYQHETRMDVPSVKVIELGGNTEIRLAYPDATSILVSPQLGKKFPVYISYGGDSVSVNLKLPYMKP
jgi:hypothetical protein